MTFIDSSILELFQNKNIMIKARKLKPNKNFANHEPVFLIYLTNLLQSSNKQK